MDFILENYEWVFSGIGVVILVWLINFIFKKKKPNLNKNKNKVIINNNFGNSTSEKKESKTSNTNNKDSCHILFIDDKHKDFKMVSILKKAGWINTKAVKDITDLDDFKVNEASIIFVDINGVGSTMFEDQGLGLAAALKKKHKTKAIILYSAEPEGNRFNKKLRIVDDSLPKNAEPYEFISLIEQYSKT